MYKYKQCIINRVGSVLLSINNKYEYENWFAQCTCEVYWEQLSFSSLFRNNNNYNDINKCLWKGSSFIRHLEKKDKDDHIWSSFLRSEFKEFVKKIWIMWIWCGYLTKWELFAKHFTCIFHEHLREQLCKISHHNNPYRKLMTVFLRSISS